jgi:hypothetical protein
MRLTKQYALFLTLLLGTLLITAARTAAQQPGKPTERVLLNFVINYSPASDPSGGLISDSAGNLYGVTTAGGKGDGGLGYGTVFEMSPTANGGWKPKSLYQFQAGTDAQDHSRQQSERHDRRHVQRHAGSVHGRVRHIH